jgi:ABC-type transport system involved in multi-copper enzyme maturation permease subunit
MKLGGITRFELRYQIRRFPTWLAFAGLVVIGFMATRDGALGETMRDDFFINSSFTLTVASIIGCLFWLLAAAHIAGDAGARDVETGMHPLAYTAPVSKGEYLGGRFLAAWLLNALILLGISLGNLLAVYVPGVPAEYIGPFRPAAYLSAYAIIALPNSFVVTAIQFSLAALSRRAMAAYLGSLLMFFCAYILSLVVGLFIGRMDLARLIDPIGVITFFTEQALGWTPIERKYRLLVLNEELIRNRLLWLGIALGAIAFTHWRFRFAHYVATGWLSRILRRPDAQAPIPGGRDVARTTAVDRDGARRVGVPRVRPTYGFAIRVRQTLATAWASFRSIAMSWGGLGLAMLPLFAMVILPSELEQLGVPTFPRTARVLTMVTTPLSGLLTPWIIVPLFIVFFAGELIWRERDAGVGETMDATPVPEWVPFVGKFLGLAMVLAVFVAMMTAAGVAVQAFMGFRGYRDFQLPLWLQVMFGLQLPEYLLFAVLALFVHVVVNQKYVAQVVAVLLYATIVFSSALGLQHNLLIYGGSPGWSYTDMRGFGASLGPWLWFKLYWAAWALVLVVAARLLWVRGREGGPRARLHLARRRFSRPTVGVAAVAIALVLAVGGYVFYNTNVLNVYLSPSQSTWRGAEYERRFRRYEKAPQPTVTSISLRIELQPRLRQATTRGTYHLVNAGAEPIDSIHIALPGALETGELVFDRPATRVPMDVSFGYRIYALSQPLLPRDSLRFDFESTFAPRGFRNSGIDPGVSENATWFRQTWLPAIGYQRSRELTNPRERSKQRLAPRPLLIASLYDTAAWYDSSGSAGVRLETVMGTDDDQIAVAPGTLKKTWTDRGRRYFHYDTGEPFGTDWMFYSARYAERKDRWVDALHADQVVEIELLHHPPHTVNLDRMLRSVRATLDYQTRYFGPYRDPVARLVEHPGLGVGLHAGAGYISYSETYSQLNAAAGAMDLPFAAMSHEVAHHWWGGELGYALVEGLGVLTESLAWYSGMRILKETYGQDDLRRLLNHMRLPYPHLPLRRGRPLLQADDPWTMYRKGPFVMNALAEYVGEANVNAALRRLLETSSPAARRTGSEATRRPTTLDLYRELNAVTPDSLKPLLRDFFEVNTFWSFDTKTATAEQTSAGTWRVTLDVEAKKTASDSAGVKTVLPMDDWVQIGIFAPRQPGEWLGKPIYVRTHRIRSGRQRIVVEVPQKPEAAGIDPYNLLDWEQGDNIERLKIP